MPQDLIQKDGDTWRLPDGTIVRRRTKRMRLIVQRQRYTYAGEYRYSRNFLLEKMVNGKTEFFPLGSDARKAAERADEIGAYLSMPTSTLETAKRLYDPKGEARKAHWATIGEVFEKHTEGLRSLGISEKTAKGYRYALVQIMRYVEAHEKKRKLKHTPGHKIDWTPWTSQCTTVLTSQQLTTFKNLWLEDCDDEEEILTGQITSDSFIRQARAVFSIQARNYYRYAGIALPDLAGWFEVPLFNAKKYFELQPVAVIRGVFQAVPALKAADLNAWRAFMLCMHVGLRKAEAAAMRWSWVETVDGVPRVSLREGGDFKPKAGHGRRVTVEPWVWKAIEGSRDSLETVMSGTATERTEDAFDRLNKWLQKHGIKAEKPTHELRKCWTSYIAKTQGLLAAQKMAGHSDPKTTTVHYADNLLPDELLPFWKGAA